MFSGVLRSKVTQFYLLALLAFFLWWVEINTQHLQNNWQNNYFGLMYSLLAIIGGLNGLRVAKRWGLFKSTVGRGISFFSLGLLSLAFGQLVFSYYNIVAKVEVPFPSLADLGYFSIVILYILGSLSLAKAAGSKFSLRTLKGKLFVVIVPVAALIFSFFLFLKNIDFKFDNLTDSVATLLTFTTPFGDAIYVSVALLTYQLSRKFLGGIMRSRILLLIFALAFEYCTEYIFLYRAGKGTYYNGGIDDLLFVTSIVIMSVGLNSLRLRKDRVAETGGQA